MSYRFLALAGLTFATLGCATTGVDPDDYDSSRAVSIDAPRSGASDTPSVDPALWQVADADTTIYLLGTFHLLPADYEWRTPVIDGAIAAADTLILETDLDPADTQALGSLMREMGFTRGLAPLQQRVDPALRPRLATMRARSGVPAKAFDLMESWAAGLTLHSLAAAELGLGEGAGVGPDLRASFAAAGKRIEGLETNAAQLALLDGLSEEAQVTFLEAMLVPPDRLKGDFAAMLEAWTSGDERAIAASFNADLPIGSELRSTLLTTRNRNWANWIDDRLDRPGVLFVAVGAGHLVGDDSLLLMLRAAGHTPQRLDD